MFQVYVPGIPDFCNKFNFHFAFTCSSTPGNREGGGGGIEKRSGIEKRCSHNLQSVHLGQRGIFERALFVIQVFSNVKTVCLLAFYCWCYYHKVKLRKRS